MKKMFAAGLALAVLMGTTGVQGAFADTLSQTASVTTQPSSQFSQQMIQALNHLNDIRKRVGLSPVQLNSYVTQAAQNHANYIVQNGLTGSFYGYTDSVHNETQGLTGFTGTTAYQRVKATGADTSVYANVNEVMADISSDMVVSVDTFMNSEYHRESLLDPKATMIGIGVANNVVVIDISRNTSLPNVGTFVYPYNGQTNVPTEFDGLEVPNPLSAYGLYKSGFLIQFSAEGGGLNYTDITTATITDSKGKNVPLIVSGYGDIYLIPKTPFDYGETYTVSISGVRSYGTLKGQSVSKTWSFTTMSDPNPTTEGGSTTTIPTLTNVDTSKFNENNVGIKLNGSYISVDPVARISGGRTFIPLRGVVEAMGGTVQWMSSTNSALIYKGNIAVKVTIGSKVAFINGRATQLDVAPFIANDRTFIPLRFVSEALGVTVGWQNDIYTATITTN